MDRRAAQRRWDELAWLVAAHSERDDPGLDLAALLAALEAAVGVEVLAGRDPAPSVSARRFARVHAAARRNGRVTNPSVLALVDRAMASLAADPTGPARGSEVVGRVRALVSGRALSGLDPPPGPPRAGSRPRAGSPRR